MLIWFDRNNLTISQKQLNICIETKLTAVKNKLSRMEQQLNYVDRNNLASPQKTT
jgi:hypothetical protein